MNTRQAMQLLSVLQNNADWDKVDSSVAQLVIDDPVGSGEQFTAFLQSGGRAGVVVVGNSTETQLARWLSLYRAIGITLDPSQVKIPERKSGFDRLIVVSKGMTPQKAFDLCTARFGGKTRKYTSESLNSVVPTSDRTADKGPYAVWVRDLQEADEELKNLSATMLTEQSIAGITLTERLLLEIAYHQETKQHLDTGNWTLCSGSRYSGGGVPDVLWGDDELEVLWNCSDNRHSRLRSRAVVTL